MTKTLSLSLKMSERHNFAFVLLISDMLKIQYNSVGTLTTYEMELGFIHGTAVSKGFPQNFEDLSRTLKFD
jgi:hypothetical protein